ncbi:hypothetical protein AYK20_04680 [Thermoplasmatales archaeon SG8-52-1]|nr:MAG: hypothetical protein AYK20_04680 [Thermoplasmatales archaeon SG8-52-1]
MIATEENPINFPVKLSSNLTQFYYIFKKKKEGFKDSMEKNAEILDEKSDENRRINELIITARSHPCQQEKNQVIVFIFFLVL